MSYCIPKHLIDKFKLGLKDGSINPDKLFRMKSADRREFLKEYVGENNAQWVNAQFEGKMILKNFQAGAVSWAKSIAGLKPEVKRDLLSRIERMQEKDLLDPKSEQEFKEDLVAHKLGTAVTLAEAAEISSLASEATKAKEVALSSPRRKEGESATPEELAWGLAEVKLKRYRDNLINEAERQTVREVLMNPKGYWGHIVKMAGQSKALRASMDVSALFRQGINTLKTSPTIWAKNAVKTFKDIAKTFKSDEDVLDFITADIISDPMYQTMKQAKLDIGVMEENFPEHVMGKVPFLRKIYAASDVAYTGFVRRVRVDTFKKFYEIAEKTGIDMADEAQLKGIGTLVNSLTGRGHLGKAEPAANALNNLFFAPRFVKAQFDVLTAHFFDKKATPFAKKMAGINLMKIVGTTAATLAIAKALDPDSVELDTASSNFGKIKVGGYTFDVTGGMGSLFVLATKVFTGRSKSATTGVVSDLNQGGFSDKTRLSTIYNFLENKLSPVASVARDWLRGETFEGNKPTILGSVSSLVSPITYESAFKNLDDPNKAGLVASIIADSVGISSQSTELDAVKTVSAMKSVEKEVKRLEKAGDDRGAQELEKKNQKILDRGEELEEYVKEVNDIQKEIKDVQDSVELSKEAKKKELNGLNKELKMAQDELNKQFKKVRSK